MRSALFIVLIFIAGCTGEPQKDPQAIVDAAIAAHGGDALERAVYAFTFRGAQFSITRDGGRFEYKRTAVDSLGRTIEDIIANDGPKRFVDGEEPVIDQITPLQINSDVNSVSYFALLPIPLNDPAVQNNYIGNQTIRGEPYDMVEITFDREGGGEDYQDTYVYWFHSERHTMDYLAYTYEVGPTETGPFATGIRFREAGNVRTVGGFRVQDYRNFTADAGTDLKLLALMYEAGTLRFVSEIQQQNPHVEPLES